MKIDEKELHWQCIRASGAGGQHVNKVSTAVQLRFDIKNSASLSDTVKARVLNSRDNRINSKGEIVIDARQHRSQQRNRQAALQRLLEFLEQASKPRLNRKPPRRPKGWNEERLQQKHQRSQTKKLRREVIRYD